MNKATKYGINGAVFIGIGNALINIIKQLDDINDEPELKFNWKQFVIAAGKGAILGGIGGFGIGAIVDYQNSLEKPLNTDALLIGLASKQRLKKTDRKYVLLFEKTNSLIEILKREFVTELNSDPIKLGSTEKGTALKNKFDIDICLAFKPNSFRSTQEMYETVFSFLKKCIGKMSIIDVRDQLKSVGVIVNIVGNKYKIDIVPYKLSSSSSNKTSGYLFKNNTALLWDNSSYTKTNIHLLKTVRLSETQKKIIVLLKHWKQSNSLPLSSHLLEYLVLDAFKYNISKIPKNFSKKIVMVFRHIARNLSVAVIKSIENTNNILTNISDQNKQDIIGACLQAIEDYEYQPNTIIDAFKN